jgi:hypothetical protein
MTIEKSYSSDAACVLDCSGCDAAFTQGRRLERITLVGRCHQGRCSQAPSAIFHWATVPSLFKATQGKNNNHFLFFGICRLCGKKLPYPRFRSPLVGYGRPLGMGFFGNLCFICVHLWLNPAGFGRLRKVHHVPRGYGSPPGGGIFGLSTLQRLPRLTWLPPCTLNPLK